MVRLVLLLNRRSFSIEITTRLRIWCSDFALRSKKLVNMKFFSWNIRGLNGVVVREWYGVGCRVLELRSGL